MPDNSDTEEDAYNIDGFRIRDSSSHTHEGQLRREISAVEKLLQEVNSKIQKSDEKLEAIKQKEGYSPEYEIERIMNMHYLSYKNDLIQNLGKLRQKQRTQSQMWNSLFKLTNMIEQLHESR